MSSNRLVLKSKRKLLNFIISVTFFIAISLFVLVRNHWTHSELYFSFIVLFVSVASFFFFRYRQIAVAENGILTVRGYFKTTSINIEGIDLIKTEQDFFCNLNDIKKIVVKVGVTETRLYIPGYDEREFEQFFRSACPSLFPYRREGDFILN